MTTSCSVPTAACSTLTLASSWVHLLPSIADASKDPVQRLLVLKLQEAMTILKLQKMQRCPESLSVQAYGGPDAKCLEDREIIH